MRADHREGVPTRLDVADAAVEFARRAEGRARHAVDHYERVADNTRQVRDDVHAARVRLDRRRNGP
jgi:hypothetical protein